MSSARPFLATRTKLACELLQLLRVQGDQLRARFEWQALSFGGDLGADLSIGPRGRPGRRVLSDPEILAIVTVAVQALLTNFINNVNQTDIDIPAVG